MSNQPLFKRISNSVFESPFFRGHKFTDNEARIYLFYLAFDANEGLHAIVPINGNYVKIYPGEVAMGCRRLAEIFGWEVHMLAIDVSGNLKTGFPFSIDARESTPITLVDIDNDQDIEIIHAVISNCLLYTSPSPRDQRGSRMPSSA